MNLQEEMEKLVKRGYEVEVKCCPCEPDERMKSKGFGFVTHTFTVYIGPVDGPVTIAESCFNEFECAMKNALERLEKEEK